MSLIKKPSGSLGQKLVFSGIDIFNPITQPLSGSSKDVLKLTSDDTFFKNVYADSDYFLLDVTEHAYKCAKDFSFKLSIAGNLYFSTTNLTLKPNVSLSKMDGVTERHYDRTIGNINANQNDLWYWHNQGYVFQAFKDFFIGFAFRDTRSTTLVFTNETDGIQNSLSSVQIYAVN